MAGDAGGGDREQEQHGAAVDAADGAVDVHRLERRRRQPGLVADLAQDRVAARTLDRAHRGHRGGDERGPGQDRVQVAGADPGPHGRAEEGKKDRGQAEQLAAGGDLPVVGRIEVGQLRDAGLAVGEGTDGEIPGHGEDGKDDPGEGNEPGQPVAGAHGGASFRGC
jgi:hypothetical protein